MAVTFKLKGSGKTVEPDINQSPYRNIKFKTASGIPVIPDINETPRTSMASTPSAAKPVGANAVGMASANLGAGRTQTEHKPESAANNTNQLANRKFGIGMQHTKTQPQPLPYAKKIQTMPMANSGALERAQQIQKQAAGTQEQLRQQNLQNIRQTVTADVQKVQSMIPSGGQRQYGVSFQRPVTKTQEQITLENQAKPYVAKTGGNLPVNTGTYKPADGTSDAMFYLNAGKAGIANSAAGVQNALSIGTIADVQKSKSGEKTDFVNLFQNMSAQKQIRDNIAILANNLVTNLTALDDRSIPTKIRRWLTDNFALNDQQAGELEQQLMEATKWNDAIQEEYIKLTEGKSDGQLYAAQMVQAIGQMAPSILANALVPGSGMMFMTTSAGGNAAMDALKQGATVEQAKNRGILSGAMEYGTEKMFGGIPGLNKGIVKLGRAGDILGEGVEEGLSTFMSGAIDRATFNPYAEDPTWEEILYDTGVGIGTSGLMQLPGGIAKLAGNAKGVVQANTSPVESVSKQGLQVIPTAAENAQNGAVQAENGIAGKLGQDYNISKGGVTDGKQQDTARIVSGTDQRRGKEIGGDRDLWWSRQKSGDRLRKYDTEDGRFRKIQGSGAFRARTETGEPLTVYHSTNADFDSFLPGKKDVGIHFGTEEQAKQRGGSRMIKAQLDIQNPLYVAVDDFGNHELDSYFEYLYEASDLANSEIEYIRTHSGAEAKDLGSIAENVAFGLMQQKPTYTTEDLMDEVCNRINRSLEADLKALGYDGFVYPNDHEGKGISYAVFDDSQITILDDGRGQQNKTQTAAGDISGAVFVDDGKMPQRERRQAWNYADKVKNEFDLDIDDKSLRGDIENLFADVRKNGWTVENESRLQELSKRMVEKSNGVLNEAESRPARDAKRFIRGTKLYITPSIKAEIEHNHGNYNAFRKKHMGKLDMKLVDSEAHPGQSIDAYYTELSNIAPEWFPAKDADMNDKDMLEQIIWFVDEDTDVYDHPFEADPEGAAEFIAGRIKKGYSDLYTKPDVDIEKAKQAFAREAQAKKALDATETKAGLSEDEKEIVSAMLKGQINPDSVTDHRIRSVYDARVENYAAQRDSRAARRNLRSRYKELAQDFAEYAGGWQDKVSGWFYDMETAERNIRDIIPDKKLADQFIEQYVTPVHTNEAEATRLKNELRGRLEKLDLGTKKVHRIAPRDGKPGLYSESAIVQMYGEGLVNDHQVKMSGCDVDRVKHAVSEFRQVYDQLLDMANEVLVANGYAPVEKRANYFPHWQEPEPTGVRKFLAKMCMKILGDDLPTDIAGITDTFRPGKKFVANYLRRQGNQTEYDALKGFDIYIDSVADVIFHTDDIQRLRALETEIRYQASDKGVQRRVRDIMEDPYLDEDAKSEAVRKILEEDRTSLSHFVTWLRKYTDTLAGKKNFSDRDWEYKVGRDLYETMKAVEGRIAANMVGGNISSAMTNFIPIFQGAGEVKAKYMAQAMKDVARSAIKYDGFADRSDFLTNRLGSDKLMKTGLEKATSVASKPFELVDRFASETLTRAKYMQNVDAGMDVDAAMADADAWAASLMADRSKGAVPLVFTEKNPVTKAFTMFQLEVNNQFRYMMKDLPRNMQDQGKAAIVGALMKIFIATGLYGELFKGLAGYDPTFNPLSLLRDLVEGLTDEEKKKSEVITDFAVDAAKEIPFVGNVLGGGRLPVSNVGDGIKETANAFLKYGTGEQTGKAFLNTLGNSAGSTAAMLLPPMGGNQLKKTVQGITAVARGKVTTTDNEGNEKIKYLVDQTPGNMVRGALFGQWSFPEAREYVEGGFKMTNAKASDVINRSEAEAGIPAKTAMSVYKSMAGLGTKAYKLEKIFSNNDLTSDQMAWLERELLNDGKPGMADQAIAAGISPKQFYYVVKRANKDDKGGTSQTEMLKELRQVKDLPENKKGGIYYQMASDSTKSKMDKANRYGISYDTWYQYITNADTNLDGKVTQKEAKPALDSMSMSLEKKAYIWKLEGWSDKTNPYNK